MEPSFRLLLQQFRRYSLPLSIIFISTAAFLLFVPEQFFDRFFERPFTTRLVAVTFLAYGLILMLFNYLQGPSVRNASDRPPTDEVLWELRRLRDLTAHQLSMPIPDEMRELIAELKAQRGATLQLEPAEKKDLFVRR